MNEVFLPFFLVFLLVFSGGGGGVGSPPPPPPAANADSAGAARKMAVTATDRNLTVALRMRLSRFAVVVSRLAWLNEHPERRDIPGSRDRNPAVPVALAATAAQ